jgi:hypothetical protein
MSDHTRSGILVQNPKSGRVNADDLDLSSRAYSLTTIDCAESPSFKSSAIAAIANEVDEKCEMRREYQFKEKLSTVASNMSAAERDVDDIPARSPTIFGAELLKDASGALKFRDSFADMTEEAARILNVDYFVQSYCSYGQIDRHTVNDLTYVGFPESKYVPILFAYGPSIEDRLERRLTGHGWEVKKRM